MKIEWGIDKGDDQIVYEVRYDVTNHHVSAGLEQQEEGPEVDIYKIKLGEEVIPPEKWLEHGFTSQVMSDIIEEVLSR